MKPFTEMEPPRSRVQNSVQQSGRDRKSGAVVVSTTRIQESREIPLYGPPASPTPPAGCTCWLVPRSGEADESETQACYGGWFKGFFFSWDEIEYRNFQNHGDLPANLAGSSSL